MPARFWQDLSTRDFAALDPERTVAVLPVAAIEQHGPHLPVAVDAELNRGLIEATMTRVGADMDVLVLPMQAIGKSNEHIAYPGTLTLESETLIRLWREIGEGVARAGLRRLVLFNSHGGQPQIADIVARDLRVQRTMLAVVCSWYRLGLPEGLFDPDEDRWGIHGGAVETSMMLHLRPDLVRMEHARDFRSAARNWADDNALLEPHGAIGFGWMTQDLNSSGAAGNASLATAEAGRAVVEHVAERFARLLAEVVRFPLENLRPAGDFVAVGEDMHRK